MKPLLAVFTAVALAGVVLLAWFTAQHVYGPSTAGSRLEASPAKERIFVATLLVEDNRGDLNLTSFVDAEGSMDAVKAHVGQYISGRFPGGHVVSMRIEPVADEIIEQICRGRRLRRF